MGIVWPMTSGLYTYQAEFLSADGMRIGSTVVEAEPDDATDALWEEAPDDVDVISVWVLSEDGWEFWANLDAEAA